MKNVQRKLLAAFAAVILFSSMAFADGDMGGGGLAGDNTTVVVKNTDRTSEEGDMGGGGLAENINWLLLTGRIIGLIG